MRAESRRRAEAARLGWRWILLPLLLLVGIPTFLIALALGAPIWLGVLAVWPEITLTALLAWWWE